MKWWRIIFVDPSGGYHPGIPIFDVRVARMVLGFSRNTRIHNLKGGFFILLEEESGCSTVSEAHPRDDHGVDQMVDWIATHGITA